MRASSTAKNNTITIFFLQRYNRSIIMYFILLVLGEFMRQTTISMSCEARAQLQMVQTISDETSLLINILIVLSHIARLLVNVMHIFRKKSILFLNLMQYWPVLGGLHPDISHFQLKSYSRLQGWGKLSPQNSWTLFLTRVICFCWSLFTSFVLSYLRLLLMSILGSWED